MQTQLISLAPGAYRLSARRDLTVWVGSRVYHLRAHTTMYVNDVKYLSLSYEGWAGELEVVQEASHQYEVKLGGTNRQFDSKFQGQKVDFVVVDDAVGDFKLRDDIRDAARFFGKSLYDEVRKSDHYRVWPQKVPTPASRRRVLLCR